MICCETAANNEHFARRFCGSHDFTRPNLSPRLPTSNKRKLSPLSASVVASTLGRTVFRTFIPLCDHTTYRVCSHRGRNGLSPYKNGSCSITNSFLLKSRCVISQEPFLYSVRTPSSHFGQTHRTRFVVPRGFCPCPSRHRGPMSLHGFLALYWGQRSAVYDVRNVCECLRDT